MVDEHKEPQAGEASPEAEQAASGVGDVTAGVVSIRRGGAGNVKAERVDILQGGARNVTGTNVTLRQAGAQTVTAEQLVIRQGGALWAKADDLDMTQGGAGLLQAQTAKLTASQVGVVLARGDVTMDQAAGRLVLAAGDVTMDQAGAAVLAARNVKAQNCSTLLLLAGHVEGDVKAAFGPRESAIFGAAVGAVAGLVLLLARLVQRRRR
jgi:ribosomal protein L27